MIARRRGKLLKWKQASFMLACVLIGTLTSTMAFSRLHPPFMTKKLMPLRMVSTSIPSSPSSNAPEIVNDTGSESVVLNSESKRLARARLRLAEAQGVIPIGASEMSGFTLSDFNKIPKSSQSRVREIGWRVAEPSVAYDPIGASQKFFRQPLVWVSRNVQFMIPVATFTISIILDILTGREEINRSRRADQLLAIVSVQSPALIKAGQALASRSDLLPKEYLDALQKLQDRCPAYPTEQAIALFESELGMKFTDAFELYSDKPVAAASIGQVYRGRLRKNGAEVAIKIQRPKCEEAIAIDLYILRFYASLTQSVLGLLKRDIDLVSVIDDFGEIIYREIDYRAEAVNAQRFAELYANIPNIFVPKVYTDLSTTKVLTMEWVDGARLNDKASIDAMGLDSSQLIDTLVQCSLRQMLENGFFHADPHAGNLLAMPSGKLCYLDFGMVSYVEASQRYSIIEAVVHLVNRDFESLANLYRRMGFIPQDVDAAPIVVALEDALPDVLNAAVGELNFKNVIDKLGDVMIKFPFSLPPYYIAIIRCLGVLEGLAIQVDKDFRIISDAYPYIASRLLTDSSEELQAALKQLLFQDGKPRYERLQDLLEKAASTSDYDVTVAMDKLITYLISSQGSSIRELLAEQVVTTLDQIGADAVDYGFSLATSSTSILRSPDSLSKEVNNFLQNDNGGFTYILNSIVASESQSSPTSSFSSTSSSSSSSSSSSTTSSTPPTMSQKPSPALVSAAKTILLLQKSVQNNSVDRDRVAALVRKVLREPVAQQTMATILSTLSEKAASRLVKKAFGQNY